MSTESESWSSRHQARAPGPLADRTASRGRAGAARPGPGPAARAAALAGIILRLTTRTPGSDLEPDSEPASAASAAGPPVAAARRPGRSPSQPGPLTRGLPVSLPGRRPESTWLGKTESESESEYGHEAQHYGRLRVTRDLPDSDYPARGRRHGDGQQ